MGKATKEGEVYSLAFLYVSSFHRIDTETASLLLLLPSRIVIPLLSNYRSNQNGILFVVSTYIELSYKLFLPALSSSP